MNIEQIFNIAVKLNGLQLSLDGNNQKIVEPYIRDIKAILFDEAIKENKLPKKGEEICQKH